MAKILVVDDSLFARLKVCDILHGAGHETLEAGDGREGLARAQEQTFDCILTDLLMPEMDGVALLAALRAAEVKTPVIVLTADIQESRRRQCLDLGAAGFLGKPPQSRPLLEAIAQLLPAGEA